MYVKIGGTKQDGSVYSNTGSCTGLVYYLTHEDPLLQEKKLQEQFFSATTNRISPDLVIKNIDSNKAKLCKKDSKFFSLIVSPSEKELKHLGETEKERIQNLKDYVNDVIMQKYAESFNKGLSNKDLLYFAKIHHTKNGLNELETHAHIIVSRKSLDNKIKLSPNTNHKNAINKGTVKSGFNRLEFFQKCETEFDLKFNYERKLEEKLQYCNTKNNLLKEELKKEEILKAEKQKIQQNLKNIPKLGY